MQAGLSADVCRATPITCTHRFTAPREPANDVLRTCILLLGYAA
jgi:hypothetical protein